MANEFRQYSSTAKYSQAQSHKQSDSGYADLDTPLETPGLDIPGAFPISLQPTPAEEREEREYILPEPTVVPNQTQLLKTPAEEQEYILPEPVSEPRNTHQPPTVIPVNLPTRASNLLQQPESEISDGASTASIKSGVVGREPISRGAEFAGFVTKPVLGALHTNDSTPTNEKSGLTEDDDDLTQTVVLPPQNIHHNSFLSPEQQEDHDYKRDTAYAGVGVAGGAAAAYLMLHDQDDESAKPVTKNRPTEQPKFTNEPIHSQREHIENSHHFDTPRVRTRSDQERNKSDVVAINDDAPNSMDQSNRWQSVKPTHSDDQKILPVTEASTEDESIVAVGPPASLELHSTGIQVQPASEGRPATTTHQSFSTMRILPAYDDQRAEPSHSPRIGHQVDPKTLQPLDKEKNLGRHAAGAIGGAAVIGGATSAHRQHHDGRNAAEHKVLSSETMSEQVERKQIGHPFVGPTGQHTTEKREGIEGNKNHSNNARNATIIAGGAAAGTTALNHHKREQEQAKLLEQQRDEQEKNAKRLQKEHNKEIRKEDKKHDKEIKKEEKKHEKDATKAEKEAHKSGLFGFRHKDKDGEEHSHDEKANQDEMYGGKGKAAAETGLLGSAVAGQHGVTDHIDEVATKDRNIREASPQVSQEQSLLQDRRQEHSPTGSTGSDHYKDKSIPHRHSGVLGSIFHRKDKRRDSEELDSRSPMEPESPKHPKDSQTSDISRGTGSLHGSSKGRNRLHKDPPPKIANQLQQTILKHQQEHTGNEHARDSSIQPSAPTARNETEADIHGFGSADTGKNITDIGHDASRDEIPASRDVLG